MTTRDINHLEALRRVIFHMRARDLEAFTFYDVKEVIAFKENTSRKRLKIWVRRRIVYKSTRMYHVLDGRNNVYLYSAIADLGLREAAFNKYLARAGGRDGKQPEPSYKSAEEMIRAGFCFRDHTRALARILPHWRFGIPDDDMILKPQEIRELREAIDSDDLRDRLLFSMMFRTGARISQNLNIRVRDLDLVNGTVYITKAKLGIPYIRRLDDAVLSEVACYINHYGLGPDEYLFGIDYLREHRSSRRRYDLWIKTGKPMSRGSAYAEIRKAGQRASIDYVYVDDLGFKRHRVDCHISKRTVVSAIYEHSKDPILSASAVGNKTTEIIQRHYIKIQSEHRHREVNEALKKLHQTTVGVQNEAVHRAGPEEVIQ